MAGSYTLPQVRVFQEFAQTPNDVTQNLNPFVIGPSYQLIRYSDSDERSDCRSGTYSGATGVTLNWKTFTNTDVDTDWYKVTLEDAYATFGTIGSATCIDAGSGDHGTKFEFTLNAGETLTDEGGTMKYGTPVVPGDYLGYKVTSTSSWEFTKIRSISRGKIESGKISGLVTKKSDGSAFNNIVATLTNYTAEVSGVINLTVNASGEATCNSSTIPGVGLTTATAIPASGATGLSLGSGIVINKAAGVTGNIAAGNYVIKITVSEPIRRDTVTVVNSIPSGLNTAAIFRRFSAVELDKSSPFLSLSTNDAGVIVDSDVTVVDGGHTFTVVTAKAYLSQRNLRKDHVDGVYTVATDSDILTNIGKITPDNPLAYAAHVMRLNCASTNIRYIALTDTGLEGYVTALERASVTTDVYALCPLTDDATIIDAVVGDVEKMSSEEEKSWRIAFFSKKTATSVEKTPYTLNANNEPVYEKCTVASSGTAPNLVYTLTCRPASGQTTDISAAADFDSSYEGDTVTVIVGDQEYPRTIKSVKSPYELILDADVSGASSLCEFKITHARNPGTAEYAQAVAATSDYFRNRRAYNVFPNRLKNTDGTFVDGMYAAAAVCALACSVAPQQPITNVELSGFSDVPDVYAKISRDQLNTIAAGGTLIVMQEKSGGTVYVRHQISTAYSGGNLNKTELSMVKNLDSISYYFANRFAPYIGRYNVTPDLLVELKGVLKDGLSHLETSTETNKLIGPQVIAEGTEIRALYQDTSEKDKVYANVALNLPAPFNNFDLHLQVI